MPIHDWTRVDAGAFHAFHTAWITHLSETLNGGVLPAGYYALPEQHAGRMIADVLTLQTPQPLGTSPLPGGAGGVAVVQVPPKVRRRLSASPAGRGTQRTLAIRHVSGHRIVALLEIVSPANKDRAVHVEEFVGKAESALWQGIHLLLADLLPPGAHDPRGIHGAIWDRFDDDNPAAPVEEPFGLASYVAGPRPEAWLETCALGTSLTDMPLFLNADRYINVPLEPTYMAAFRGLPAVLRDVLEPRA